MKVVKSALWVFLHQGQVNEDQW